MERDCQTCAWVIEGRLMGWKSSRSLTASESQNLDLLAEVCAFGVWYSNSSWSLLSCAMCQGLHLFLHRHLLGMARTSADTKSSPCHIVDKLSLLAIKGGTAKLKLLNSWSLSFCMSGRIHGACSAYCTSLEDSVFSEIHSDNKNVGGKAENQVPSFSGSSCRSVPLTYFAPTTLVFGFSFE